MNMFLVLSFVLAFALISILYIEKVRFYHTKSPWIKLHKLDLMKALTYIFLVSQIGQVLVFVIVTTNFISKLNSNVGRGTVWQLKSKSCAVLLMIVQFISRLLCFILTSTRDFLQRQMTNWFSQSLVRLRKSQFRRNKRNSDLS